MEPAVPECYDQWNKVPEEYEEFSFHSYEAIPLPTEHLKPFEILKLRDEKFNQYFEKRIFK